MYLPIQHQNYLTWANIQTQAIRFELLNQAHIFPKIHFWVTIPRNSKTLGFTVPDTQIILGSYFEPAFHGHYRPQIQPIHDSNHKTPFSYPHSRGPATGCSIWFQKNSINSVPCFWTDPTAPNGLNRLKHSKNTKNGNKTQVGRKSYLLEFEETPQIRGPRVAYSA